MILGKMILDSPLIKGTLPIIGVYNEDSKITFVLPSLPHCLQKYAVYQVFSPSQMCHQSNSLLRTKWQTMFHFIRNTHVMACNISPFFSYTKDSTKSLASTTRKTCHKQIFQERTVDLKGAILAIRVNPVLMQESKKVSMRGNCPVSI